MLKKNLILLIIFIVSVLLGCQPDNAKENVFITEENVLGYEILIKNIKKEEIKFAQDIFYISSEEDKDVKVILTSKEGLKKNKVLFTFNNNSEIEILNKITEENLSKKRILSNEIVIVEIPFLEENKDEIEIKVKLRKLFNTTSINIEFVCDLLGEFYEVELGEIFENNTNIIFNKEKNKILLAYTGINKSFLDDTIFKLKFKLTNEGKEKIKSGTVNKFFKIDNISYEQSGNIKKINTKYYPLEIEDKSLIKPLGDYNEDGFIDLNDFNLLKYFYGSKESENIKKYDIASDKDEIAFKGKKGNLKKVYTGKIADGKIGLAELIVLVNNMQVWDFIDLEKEIYLELDIEKSVLKQNESFKINLNAKLIKDNSLINDLENIIEKTELKRLYNNITETLPLNIDIKNQIEIKNLQLGVYELKFFLINGETYSVDFEIIDFIENNNIRIKCIKNEDIFYGENTIELIADGIENIYLITEKKENEEYSIIDKKNIVYKYIYNDSTKEYSLNADVFSTKKSGIYELWGEYKNGDTTYKTDKVKINALPGIKYVRIYTDKTEYNKDEIVKIKIELIDMSNENVIKDMNTAYDIIKNTEIILENNGIKKIVKLSENIDNIEIDKDYKQYIYNYLPDIEGNVKISGKYVYENGTEIYSEISTNQNGRKADIFIGKTIKSMILTIKSIETINETFSAIKVIKSTSFDKNENPSRIKKKIYNSYTLFYYNNDINFDTINIDEIIKKDSIQVEKDNPELIDALQNSEKDFLFLKDLYDNNKEDYTFNILKNGNSRVYFKVDFYNEDIDNLIYYDEYGALKIDDNVEKINEISEKNLIKLYYYENGINKSADINNYRTFDKNIPQNYIDFFAEYKNFSSEFIRINLIDTKINSFKLYCSNNINYYINNNIIVFEKDNLEIEITAKDQAGEDISIDSKQFDIYLIDKHTPSIDEGNIKYINDYPQFEINKNKYINPISIKDSDSFGKLSLSESNFARGKFYIDLNTNFIKNENELLYEFFYVMVRDKNNISEDVIEVNFIER